MTLLWNLPWVVAGLVSVFTVWWSMRSASRWGLVDESNHRSLHSGSKPLTGGLGILLAVACGWLLASFLGYPPTHWLALALATLAVAGVSLLDDLRDVSPLPRFAMHFLASVTPLVAGFGLQTLAVPGGSVALGLVASTVLTVVFVAWFINLYNFMDGMDGFAGGMTLFGFGFLAILGLLGGDAAFALAAAVVAASAAGFLVFNFPPARLFMGDAGAAPLGFLVGAFGLWADASGVAPVWVTVMIFSPFFLDATVTAGRRVMRRERFWEAHRSHYYQRIVQAGWTHRRTVLAEYVLMIGCGVTALCIANSAVWLQWAAIIVWLLVYSVCIGFVHRRELARRDSS